MFSPSFLKKVYVKYCNIYISLWIISDCSIKTFIAYIYFWVKHVLSVYKSCEKSWFMSRKENNSVEIIILRQRQLSLKVFLTFRWPSKIL